MFDWFFKQKPENTNEIIMNNDTIKVTEVKKKNKSLIDLPFFFLPKVIPSQQPLILHFAI